MTPKQIVELALQEGRDTVQFLIDYMAEKDSHVSRKWAEMMVNKYKEQTMNTKDISFQSQTSYQAWCQEKKLPAYTAEKFLQFMMFTDYDVEEQDFSVYDMRWAVFVRQTMSVVR